MNSIVMYGIHLLVGASKFKLVGGRMGWVFLIQFTGHGIHTNGQESKPCRPHNLNSLKIQTLSTHYSQDHVLLFREYIHEDK